MLSQITFVIMKCLTTRFLNQVMLQEVLQQAGAARYEQTATQKPHRNGYKDGEEMPAVARHREHYTLMSELPRRRQEGRDGRSAALPAITLSPSGRHLAGHPSTPVGPTSSCQSTRFAQRR